MKKNRGGLFDQALECYGDRIAFTYTDAENRIHHMTYEYVQENVKKFGSFIEEQKLLLILTANNIESVIGYLSGISSRTAVMLIRENACEEILYDLVAQFMPDYIWTKNKKGACTDGYFYKYEWNEYVLYERKNPSDILLNEELALLLPTSGTTGASKYVKLTYRNVKDNTEAIIDALKISGTDVTITSLPIYYTYGLSLINTYLMQGARVVLTTQSYLRAEFWELFRREKVSSVSGVPFFYEMLFKMNMEEMGLSSISVMTQAGGRLLPELQIYFGAYARKKGIRFYVMYGQTEATARMTVLPCHMVEKKIGSVGLPIRGGKVIIDRSREGQKGEIVYYGNNICGGYAYERKDLSYLLQQECLKTGDIGFTDDDGYLYVCGRTDRVVKLHGNRIDLNELENLIFKKWGIVCKSCFKNNQIYIITPGHEKDLMDYLHDVTGLNRRYFQIVEKKEMPRNEYGKYIDLGQ